MFSVAPFSPMIDRVFCKFLSIISLQWYLCYFSVIFDHFRWLSASTGASHASTVDEEEVERFSRLADNWWDESGEFGALHSMNDLRIPLIRDGLLTSSSSDRSTSLPLKGLKILDVGCGGGILCEVRSKLR